MAFGLAAALYFGGGTAYRQRTKGWGAMPRAELRCGLRLLVSDGTAFSQARASGGGGRGRGGRGGGGGRDLRKVSDFGSAAKKERLLESRTCTPRRRRRGRKSRKSRRKRSRGSRTTKRQQRSAVRRHLRGGGGTWIHVPT
jgi:hypothetical protein